MARRYVILDVFSDRTLAGNPLAVVLDGNGLDTAAMQCIAREFNLSETTFVTAPENPAASARVRIFTPTSELDFAGHPTIGTAVILAGERLGAATTHGEAMVVLEENVGLVRCGVTIADATGGRAKFTIPRLPEEVVATDDRDMLNRGAIAQALGLTTADIGFENHVPAIFHAGGSTFIFVPLRDQSAVTAAGIKSEYWAQAFGADGKAYLYCRETVHHGRQFHARCFAPGACIPEDPATGSAVAAFAGVVMRFDCPRDGTHKLEIEQGFAIGRPGVIGLGLTVSGGQLTQARISGAAVIVARGELLV